MGSAYCNESKAEWVFDAKAPGGNVPEIGTSLFDKIFPATGASVGKHSIPYPFETLKDHLKGLVADVKTNPVLSVMIPIGRSLHREAAAPEYFKFPRKLIAVHSDPHITPGHVGINLKIRLFLLPIRKKSTN